MGDYQPLRSEGEGDGSVIHHGPITSTAKEDLYYKQPWTPLRKIAFVSSLMLCVLTIVVFLWVLPCEWSSCPANIQQLGWDKTLYGLELKGQMSVVETSNGVNLIAMVRGAIWNNSSMDKQPFPPHHSGIVSLAGRSGMVTWWAILGSPPVQLACTLLDIDNNGVTDCLVQGEHGYLVAINAESGMTLWKFGQNLGQKEILENITFPVIIPDLNNDKVNDLAAICLINGVQKLVLISGKTGHILGKPYSNPACSDMYGLALDDDAGLELYFTCKDSNSYNKVIPLPLSEVVTHAMNKTIGMIHKTKLKQHTSIGLSNEYHVGKHRLVLSRNGRCPDLCAVTLNITSESNQSDWSDHAEYTYVMNPVLIHFNNTTGFVLKFWQWPPPEVIEKMNKTRIEKIREQVILVTFNATGGIHVVNASQTDIVQICGIEGCQPDVEFQMNSMMIVDLDKDGSQELVLYSVSYKRADLSDQTYHPVETHNWELQSKIRVIRLEAELPMIYKSILHQ